MAYTTIKKPTDYFNTITYTGNATNSTARTVGFDPDWIWVKNRGLDNHYLMDTVSCLDYNLETNNSDAQARDFLISGTTSTGWTSSNSGEINANNGNYVAWNWKANGAGSSNTDGSITSTVSANTTSGFSIVSYTGTGSDATVGHGLGVTPKIIFWKRRDNTAGAVNWIVQSTLFGNQTKLVLNTSEAFSTNATFSQTNNWDSSTIDLKTYEGQNSSSATYIAYCFAEKKGFSKFGSYIGNGNADGTFVYTGFKPAFVMTKKTSGTADWMIRDSKRDFNGSWRDLYANNTNAETSHDSNTKSELLSTGFKLRMTH